MDGARGKAYSFHQLGGGAHQSGRQTMPISVLVKLGRLSMKVVAMMKNFWKEEEGLTMVEYALIGALVVVGAIGAFTTLGQNVSTKVNAIATSIT